MDLALTITDQWLWYQNITLFTICITYISGISSVSHTKMCQQHRLMIDKPDTEHIIILLCLSSTTSMQDSWWDSTGSYNVSPCTTLQTFKSLTSQSYFILNGTLPHFIYVSTTLAAHVCILSTFEQQHACYQSVQINLVVRTWSLWLQGR